MIFLQFCQLGPDNLPLPFSDFLGFGTTAADARPFSLLSSHDDTWIVLVILLSQGPFKLYEVRMLLKSHLFTLLSLFLCLLQLLLHLLQLLLQLSNRLFDVLILVKVQFLLLLLFDIFYVF